MDNVVPGEELWNVTVGLPVLAKVLPQVHHCLDVECAELGLETDTGSCCES